MVQLWPELRNQTTALPEHDPALAVEMVEQKATHIDDHGGSGASVDVAVAPRHHQAALGLSEPSHERLPIANDVPVRSPALASLELEEARAAPDLVTPVVYPEPARLDVTPIPPDPEPGFTTIERTAWVFARENGSQRGLSNQGQLGGSQAGVRLSAPILQMGDRPLKANLRISRSLGAIEDSEAAVGLTYRPVESVPLDIAVERRVALGRHGRNAFAAGVAGGFDHKRVSGSWSLSGYGQAGVVGLEQKDGYVDGAVRIDREIGSGTAPIRAGLQISGGAQPGTSRLDIGPRVALRVVGGPHPVSVAVEWRERVAGQARPSSGLAVTVFGGF